MFENIFKVQLETWEDSRDKQSCGTAFFDQPEYMNDFNFVV